MHTKKLYTAVFIAALFHVCGAAGILFTQYKQWFIDATPVTLLLMAALAVYTQKEKKAPFFIFLLLAFAAGMAAEITGVHTGLLFGSYAYTHVLGPDIFGVPLLIGVNWFTTVYCCGCVTHIFEDWIIRKIDTAGEIPGRMQFFSFVIDASLLTVFYDWLLEPAAIKLGFWKWGHEAVPVFNYVCWFFISAALMTVFRKLNFNKRNIFALHLLIIQILFFLTIETFL